MRVNPRSLRNEADWLPQGPRDAARVYEQLIAAGYVAQQARGLVAWLTLKAAGIPDSTDAHTRSSYRKILASLSESPDPGRNRYDAGATAG